VWAIPFSKEINYQSFDEAKNSKSDSVGFEIKSTKLGMVTTRAEGLAKKAKLTADLETEAAKVSNIILEIEANQLDTDISSRNEKMHDLCFEVKKYPKIIVKVASTINLSISEQKIPAILTIRGNDYPIEIFIKSNKQDNQYVIEGNSELSFKNLNIPDPSIFIAKVLDPIQVKFKFFIK
jgi:polyisoprenoid-binding protein YceI